jgi:DNA-damage-inducible protein J
MEDHVMSANAVVRARIDERIRGDRRAGGHGADPLRMLCACCSSAWPAKALPFEPLIPNDATIAAMKEARRHLPAFATVEALMADLNAED